MHINNITKQRYVVQDVFCMVGLKEVCLNETDIKSNIPTRVHHFMADCTKLARSPFSAGRYRQSLNTFLLYFYDTRPCKERYMKFEFLNKVFVKKEQIDMGIH